MFFKRDKGGLNGLDRAVQQAGVQISRRSFLKKSRGYGVRCRCRRRRQSIIRKSGGGRTVSYLYTSANPWPIVHDKHHNYWWVWMSTRCAHSKSHDMPSTLHKTS
jgi:hypothetical protein